VTRITLKQNEFMVRSSSSKLTRKVSPSENHKGRTMKISIGVPEGSWVYFMDIAKAFYRCCLECGLTEDDVELVKFRQLSDYNRGDINFFFGVHIFGLPLPDGKMQQIIKPEGAVWVWYQLEQLPYVEQSSQETVLRWHNTTKLLPLFDRVVVESSAKQKFLADNKVESSVLNCGFHSQYEVTAPKVEVKEPDWDVFFYGLITDRRRDIIEEIINRKLKLYPFAATFLSGAERLFAIRNSKAVINVHMSDVEYFEKPRIICDCLSNKAFVVTENLRHSEGFINGTHLVMASYADLVDVLEEWLAKSKEERDKIGEAGYTYISKEYRLLPGAEMLLKEVGLVA